MHGRRVGVVPSHEGLDPGPAGTEAQRGREPVLEVEGEVILVGAGREVHRVAHAPEEVERGVHVVDVAIGEHAEGDQIAEAAHLELHLRHPERGVQVAQPAQALLQLRLQQVDAVAVLDVTLLALLQLLLEEGLAVRRPDLLDDEVREVVVRRAIAAQVARVEERRLHLEIAGRQAAALAHVAHRRPDDEARVPETPG